LDVIFEPFRQIDGSMTRRHGGIGLGLALSSKLARTMGGRLSVQSEVGAGSTFELVLPAAPEDAVAADLPSLVTSIEPRVQSVA
jgi:signal transduction histidine kinase